LRRGVRGIPKTRPQNQDNNSRQVKENGEIDGFLCILDEKLVERLGNLTKGYERVFIHVL
jgi:hypothetical protein